MLKQILVYIASRDGPNIDFKEFAMNHIAIAYHLNLN